MHTENSLNTVLLLLEGLGMGKDGGRLCITKSP